MLLLALLIWRRFASPTQWFKWVKNMWGDEGEGEEGQDCFRLLSSGLSIFTPSLRLQSRKNEQQTSTCKVKSFLSPFFVTRDFPDDFVQSVKVYSTFELSAFPIMAFSLSAVTRLKHPRNQYRSCVNKISLRTRKAQQSSSIAMLFLFFCADRRL